MPNMTKADYELIAEVFHNAYNAETDGNKMWQLILDNLVGEFTTDNPRFDRDKFLVACGVRNPEEWANPKDYENAEVDDFGVIRSKPE